jgi:serine/threonine protein kinase
VAYYSPETLLGVEHTKKTDVWSVGIYFAALLLGLEPIPWELIEGGQVQPIHLIEKVRL